MAIAACVLALLMVVSVFLRWHYVPSSLESHAANLTVTVGRVLVGVAGLAMLLLGLVAVTGRHPRYAAWGVLFGPLGFAGCAAYQVAHVQSFSHGLDLEFHSSVPGLLVAAVSSGALFVVGILALRAPRSHRP